MSKEIKLKLNWEDSLKVALAVKPIFQLGKVLRHNGRECRIHAYRFEVRPMGNFKIYECSYEETGHKFDTTEEILLQEN